MLAPATTPDPTPELEACEPQPGETGMDALARVGDTIAKQIGGADAKDDRKNKKLPKQLAALVLLRAQGFDNAEIADKLHVPKRKVASLIARARKEYGWDDLGDTLVNYAVPRAVENVLKHLDEEGSAASLIKGQHLMTREVLKGVGILKSHTASKQESRRLEMRVLRVEIGLPPGDGASDAANAGVMGTPRRAALPTPTPAPAAFVEGEVVGAK